MPFLSSTAPGGKAGPSIQFDRLFMALAEAMSLRKLGFFMVGMAATWVVVLLLLWLAAASKSLVGMFVVVPLVTILALGMSGVLAGGVAYMLRAKAEGRLESVGESCSFCGRRFLSLFGGMLLVLFVLGLVSVVVNGILALLAGVQGLSLLAAALLIPQVLFNLVLALAALTIVLVPCAIARRDIGAIEALQSVTGLIRRDTASLLVHTGLALFVGGVLTSVLVGLLLSGLGPTLACNGPDLMGGVLGSMMGSSSRDSRASAPDFRALFGGEEKTRGGASARNRSPFEADFLSELAPRDEKTEAKRAPERKEPGAVSSFLRGDWLRWLSLLVLLLGAISYPAVFWICAMSGYYEGTASTAPGPAKQ